MNDSRSALETIKDMVLGNFYSVVEFNGCNWGFYFETDVWFSAQVIKFPEEGMITNCLGKCNPIVLNTYDTEIQAQAVMVLKNRGVPVIEVSMIKNNELILRFENGHEMLVKTDTDIVDWHWSFSKSRKDAYHEDTIVACYYADEKL